MLAILAAFTGSSQAYHVGCPNGHWEDRSEMGWVTVTITILEEKGHWEDHWEEEWVTTAAGEEWAMVLRARWVVDELVERSYTVENWEMTTVSVWVCDHE